jgi:serine/threonine protein kinase
MSQNVVCYTCGELYSAEVGRCPRCNATVQFAPERAAAAVALSGTMTLPHRGVGSSEGAEEPPGALVGRSIGEYVVQRLIGKGGMGVVYEGESLQIGRKVAIKFLRADMARESGTSDLLREAQVASGIRHRGIVDIFGFGHLPGFGPYIIMDYLEGESLAQVIARRAPLRPLEVIGLLIELCDALSAAHAEGVIHRDLKPSNVFVVRQSNGSECVKVLDFGIAKKGTVPYGHMSQTTGALKGTPLYMAPEHFLGEALRPATDMYAVGVIAFEMLTGQQPFPIKTLREAVEQHVNRPPPAPSSRVELPEELDKLVLLLLAKEPAQRPGTMQVVRELKALARRMTGEPARRSPPAAWTWPWVPSVRDLLLLATGAGLGRALLF